MMARLSKNPTLVTLLLSVAAVAGYVAYRFTVGGSGDGAAMQSADSMNLEDHSGHAAQASNAMLDSLPEVALVDMDGNPTYLSDVADRPLLINFWATWCAPCLREIPLLKSFQDENPGIRVVGIAVDYADKVHEYAEDMEFNYPVLIGQTEGMNAMATFRNNAAVMPFSVFTAADGAMLGKHAGELHQEHLDNLAATLEALAAGDIDRATARDQLAGLR